MKLKRIIAATLAVMLAFSTLAGCGAKKSGTSGDNQSVSEKEDSKAKSGALFDIRAEKIGHTDKISYGYAKDNGFVYRDDKKSGIISPDGKHDTGAIYTGCQSEDGYFTVTKVENFNIDDVNTVNTVGLVDGEGKVLIPEEYCGFEVLNGGKYVQAIKVTKKTTDKDASVVTLTPGLLSNLKFDDTMFEGEWVVYNVENGKKVEGLSSNKRTRLNAYGDFIEYYDENSKRVCVDARTGKAAPDYTFLYSDGSYLMKEGNDYVVYDNDGKKLFSKNYNEMYIESMYYGNYQVSVYSGGESKQALVDKTGKMISSGFEGPFSSYGTVIKNDDRLFKLDGTQIADHPGNVHVNETCSYIVTENNLKYCIYNENLEKIFDDKFSSGERFDIGNLAFGKKSGDEYNFYSFKDKDYTIRGSSSIGFGAVNQRNDNSFTLIDIFSGKTLIEGYRDYEKVSVEDKSCYYIFAELNDETYDIYKITVE